MKGSWFALKSSYSDVTGVELEIWGRGGVTREITLTRKDVSYLLESVDGHVIAGPIPISHVAFPLYGLLVDVNDAEWHEFVEALSSVAGQGGWQPQFIA